MRLSSALLALSAVTLGYAQTKSGGDATWFHPGVGACGRQDTIIDFIVAVDHATFDTWPGATANPNANPICNRRMRVSAGGKSVNVIVVDKCPKCGPGSVDLSPTAFNQLAPLGVGRIVGITWTML